MLRPSFQRGMPPLGSTRLGGSFRPSMNIMPLTRGTRGAPATPGPYSFQQRQPAKYFGDISGSQGLCGALPCQVSQSTVFGERSKGGGYSHAPVGSLRPREPSTIIRSPMVPCAINSLALTQRTELTRCEPIWITRPVALPALTISKPSEGEWDMGFSQ